MDEDDDDKEEKDGVVERREPLDDEGRFVEEEEEAAAEAEEAEGTVLPLADDAEGAEDIRVLEPLRTLLLLLLFSLRAGGRWCCASLSYCSSDGSLE